MTSEKGDDGNYMGHLLSAPLGYSITEVEIEVEKDSWDSGGMTGDYDSDFRLVRRDNKGNLERRLWQLHGSPT